jgi:hypothetical protein
VPPVAARENKAGRGTAGEKQPAGATEAPATGGETSAKIKPAGGGAILAHGESRAEHDARIALAPFVVEGVVTAETFEIDPKRTFATLDFLKAAQ